MNREQMIEQAARAMHQRGLERGAETATWEDLPTSVKYQYRDVAEAAVDAVLPQVTTVEQLEALPTDAVVVAADGHPFRRDRDGWIRAGSQGIWLPEWIHFPLTVAWQP